MCVFSSVSLCSKGNRKPATSIGAVRADLGVGVGVGVAAETGPRQVEAAAIDTRRQHLVNRRRRRRRRPPEEACRAIDAIVKSTAAIVITAATDRPTSGHDEAVAVVETLIIDRRLPHHLPSPFRLRKKTKQHQPLLPNLSNLRATTARRRRPWRQQRLPQQLSMQQFEQQQRSLCH